MIAKSVLNNVQIVLANYNVPNAQKIGLLINLQDNVIVKLVIKKILVEFVNDVSNIMECVSMNARIIVLRMKFFLFVNNSNIILLKTILLYIVAG